MALPPGARIGAYQILTALGEGGMGEVYRARDTLLGRDVAIKTLSAAFAADPERLARFTREARVLAALNHPHIGAIYGVEAASLAAPPALVLELVEGETLAAVLARGPVPLARALALARQIVEAIDFAHQRGIVHRDLKPANIKVTPDGKVKVLDFGIAKALDPAGDPESPSAITRPPVTEAGLVLGTPAYMSPEQARGELVNRRTDIWAFGCLLYEMLTGARAFPGRTASDAMAAVLQREPAWQALPAAIPPAVRRVVRRCLEKDMTARLRDIGDARPDLTEARADESATPTVSSRRRVPPAWALGAALLIAAIGVGAGRWSTPSAAPALRPPEPTRVVRLTSGPARDFAPAISPDGKWVAYLSAGTTAADRTDVWVRYIGGGDPINLTASTDLDITSTAGNRRPRHRPGREPHRGDGEAASQHRPLRDVGAASAAARRAAQAARRRHAGSPVVPGRPAGRIHQSRRVGRRCALGCRRRRHQPPQIITADAGIHIHWAAWSVDRQIYFNRTRSSTTNLDQSDLYRVSAAGGPPEPVVRSPRRAMYPVPSPDARGLFYASDEASASLALFWRPLPDGAAVSITRGIGDYSEARPTADGRVLVATYSEVRQSLSRLVLGSAGVVQQSVTDGFSGDLDPTVSPRSDRLVFSSSRNGSRTLWASSLDGSRVRPLTTGDVLDQWPALSPDGRTVAFVSDRAGRRGIWLVDAEGGSPRRLNDAESIGVLSWTRDGKAVLYSADDGQWPGLFTMSVDDGKTQRLVTAGVGSDPACSPVEDVVAYMSPRTEGPAFTELRFVDLQGNPRYQHLPPSPAIPAGLSNGHVAWSPDGRRLAIVSQNSNSPSSIWLIEPASARPEFRRVVELPPGPRIRGLTWSPDGGSLIIGKHDTVSDIVLIELRP